jgi:hypothetical protein
MNFQAIRERWNAVYASVSAIVVAVRSILRGLALFISARPKTPLRVLCIMAFDTLHLLRHAKPLPMLRLRILAALLDFGACANAAFDNKNCCWHEWRKTLQLLEEAGLRSLVVEYLRRLADLESMRPLPGGDCRRFEKVALYREAVVRLSLGMVATTANDNQCLDEAIRATYCDGDLNILFRIVMQCQIIDDVLDYSTDMSTGLPSFLTASNSLPQAVELTRLAALGYADDGDVPRTAHVFPLRSALFLVSTCTRLAIVLARWRQGTHLGQQFTERVYGPRLLAADGTKRAPLTRPSPPRRGRGSISFR